MDRWLRRLTTIGVARGLRGSRGWLVTGMAAVGLRALRRLANPGPEVLYRTVEARRSHPGDRPGLSLIHI